MRISIGAALCCLFAVEARAGSFVDGNWLYKQCAPKPNASCYAYLMAVAEALDKDRAVASEFFQVCLPAKTETSQLSDVAVKALTDFPARRTDPAFNIAAFAFIEAWPCRK